MYDSTTSDTYCDVVQAPIHQNPIRGNGCDGLHNKKVQCGLVIRILRSHLVDAESNGDVCKRGKLK